MAALIAAATVVFITASTSPAAVDVNRSTEEANALLARLKASSRGDLIAMTSLTDATIESGILVASDSESQPLYYLHPIRARAGGCLGIVAVDAESGTWSWYSFGFHEERYPRVSAAEASDRARQLLADRSAAGAVLAEPRAVTLADRQVYWRIDGVAGGERLKVLVPFDAPAEEPLSTLDESLDRHLASLPQANRPLPPPAGWIAPPPALPRTRPAVCTITAIPHHFQITSWYCGPASGQMIFDSVGEEIGQHDIADVENDDPGMGTYTDDNRRAGHFSAMNTAIQNPALRGWRERTLGYASNENFLSSDPYNYLKDAIVDGYPVEICTCYDGSCSVGHFRVVKGYDDLLNEFILQDPWYSSPYWGADLHMNQQFLVETLWGPWSWYWGLMMAPWRLEPVVPESVAPGDTFTVDLGIAYPGPGPFAGQFAASPASATIQLPEGLQLAEGSATILLATMVSGDSAHVSWRVIAGGSGVRDICFQAQGIVSGSTWSAGAYSDSIGGHARSELVIGAPPSSTWGADERITSNPAASNTTYPNARASDMDAAGALHLVWADTRDGNSEIYYRKRDDGAWGPESRLTTDPGFSDCPAIAGSPDGKLHVVWVDTRAGNQDIFYKRWDGSSWSPDLALTTNIRGDFTPAITVDTGGNIHVVWQASRPTTYYMRILHRIWNGASWSPEAIVASVPGCSLYYPSIATGAAGKVHLVYEQDTPNRGPADIYYRVYSGAAWSAATALTLDPAYARCPSIATGPDSVVHVVWKDGRNGDGDIYYRRFAGGTWGPETDAVDDPADADYPSVTAESSGKAELVWEDYRNGGAALYHRSNADGVWSAETRLTHGSGAASLPCLALESDGSGCVVWTDYRDGNTEIYCKRRSAVATTVAAAGAPASNDGRADLIRAVWPVPATGAVTLEFVAPREDRLGVRVFDAAGRAVCTLGSIRVASGPGRIIWDGRDERGKEVAAGVYFVRVDLAGMAQTRRVVLLTK